MKIGVGALLRSKTVWGAVLGAGAYLLQAPHIDLTTVTMALGTVLSAIGVRDAIGEKK